MFGDLLEQWEHYNLDVLQINTWNIYNTINEKKNEGRIQYKYADIGENLLIVKNTQDKMISAGMRDVVWFISLRHLP